MKLSDLSKATTERLGKVEKATTAEVEAGTTDKFPDAAEVKTYVDSVVGDIASALDAINGEVV